MKKQNATLVELWAGTLFFTVVALAAGIWFVENKTAYALGLAVGMITAGFMAWHMARSIDKVIAKAELGLDGSAAMRVSSILRYGLVILILVGAAFVSDWINPISVFIGVMGLKVAAYLQPFTHKIVFKVFGWEEEIYPEMPEGTEE